MPTNEPADMHILTDLQQIKALADPLRQKIVGAIAVEPRTTKQVAEMLGQPPTRLYHHVDLLEKLGLIRLVSTKPKRGTTEKYFQAIAHRFAISENSLGGEGGTAVGDALAEAFESAQKEMRKAIEASRSNDETPQAVMALGAIRISPKNLLKLRERILQITEELDCGPAEEREFFRYLVAVYPSEDSTT